jgi:hypothetical protein
MPKRHSEDKGGDVKQGKDGNNTRISEVEYDAYLIDLMIAQGCPQTWQGTWEERRRSSIKSMLR